MIMTMTMTMTTTVMVIVNVIVVIVVVCDFFFLMVLVMVMITIMVMRHLAGWKPWSSWGSCSRTCDGGRQTRRRRCTHVKPKTCEGTKRQHRKCNTFKCKGGRRKKKQDKMSTKKDLSKGNIKIDTINP